MKFEPSDFPAGPRVVFSGWAGILIPVLVFIFLIHSAPANAGTMVNFCGMVTTGTSEFGSCAVSGGAMASGTVQQEDGFSDLVLGNINLSDPGPNAVSGTALLAQNNFDFPIFFVGPPGGEFPVGIQQQVKVDAFGVFTTTFPEVSDGTDFVNDSLLLTCTEPDLPCSPFSAEAGFQFPAGSSKYPGSGFQLGRIDNAGPGDLELSLDYSLQPGDSLDLNFYGGVVPEPSTFLLFGTGFLTLLGTILTKQARSRAA